MDLAVVQTTLIRSTKRGTLRGLYPQVAPHPQTKLVQVLRRGSPGFGRHVAVTLDAAGGRLLLVPPGFAHGFLTLADETEVLPSPGRFRARHRSCRQRIALGRACATGRAGSSAGCDDARRLPARRWQAHDGGPVLERTEPILAAPDIP